MLVYAGKLACSKLGCKFMALCCCGLFCVGIFHTQLRAELLAPVVSSKSGYGMSWCPVPSVLSIQGPAYCSLPRVNKSLANVWILQEAMWDWSIRKAMGWDQGAV